MGNVKNRRIENGREYYTETIRGGDGVERDFDMQVVNDTHYHASTPTQVIDALERARTGRYRVRLWYGHTEGENAGKSWHEENDVTGYIGRSTGPRKIPLIVYNIRSHGGPAILDDCIVKIMSAGRIEYQHSNFDGGDFTINILTPGDALCAEGYRAAVDIDGKNHANFRSLKQATRWVKFMQGERMGK